jgi:hypothetical protein
MLSLVVPAATKSVDLLLENMVSVIYIYFLWNRSVVYLLQLAWITIDVILRIFDLLIANQPISINYISSPTAATNNYISSMICSLHTAVSFTASSSAIINMSSVIAQLVLT